MISPLSNTIAQLNEQELLTIEEVLGVLILYTVRYHQLFQRVLSIKREVPSSSDETRFRGHVPQTHELYEAIDALLEKFHEYLKKFEAELSHNAKDSTILSDNIRNLLKALEKFVSALQALYQDKSTSFASVLQDILLLQQVIQKKIIIPDVLLQSQTSIATQTFTKRKKTSAMKDTALLPQQKYVYVRIFHRLMPTLGTTETTNFAWVSPLLDSVKHPEKHGFGVYADQESVMKSIKDAHYGYITLRIHEEQDITSQRPPKYCPIVGCSLLTIANITLENMLTLTHEGRVYEIRDGALYTQDTSKC